MFFAILSSNLLDNLLQFRIGGLVVKLAVAIHMLDSFG